MSEVDETDGVDVLSSSARYVELFPLARGGLGQVSLVSRKQGSFQRVYAMKRLHTHFANDTQIQRMFLEEARIAGMLRHTNIASVIDVGDDKAGPFLIMEYVEGVSVRAIRDRFPWPETVPLEVVIGLVSQTARGLHAAHTLRAPDGTPTPVVHRDISPANVLVGFDGGVRVADFGVAKALGSSPETSGGVLKGKLSYMSPEQLGFRDVDARSDIFALGVLFYELISGSRLYRESSTTETARRILDEEVPDITEVRRDLPSEVVELLFEMLAKDRSERPASAEAVADRLERVELLDSKGASPAGIARFVGEHFATTRLAKETRLEQALAGQTEAPDIQAVETLTPTRVEGAGRRAPAAEPRRARIVGLAALVTLSLGSMAWWLSSSTEPALQPDENATIPALVAPAETSSSSLPVIVLPQEPTPNTGAQPDTMDAPSLGGEANVNAEPNSGEANIRRRRNTKRVPSRPRPPDDWWDDPP